MHELHRQAAEHHELAARAHRTAAEHNEKGEDAAENPADRHLQRVAEHSGHAYRLAKDAHNKSGQMETN